MDELMETETDLSLSEGPADATPEVTVFANARVMLPDREMRGAVIVEDGMITDLRAGEGVPTMRGATVIDCDGDILMPGMVELHTDNIEKHVLPRPGAMWPPLAAAVAHDMQIAAAGITTVFDSVAVGAFDEGNMRLRALEDICVALEQGEGVGLFKARHLLHLRCEVGFPGMEDLLPPLIGRPLVGLISVMDHTPGQRQFKDESKYVEYYQFKHGFSDEEMATWMAERKRDQKLYSDPNRAYVVREARAHGHALASHDDATEAHVEEAVRDGMTIAEFPTTVEAAAASHNAGLAVLMGAPNIVRGGSHSGNVAAVDLARRGLLDVVSSDYAPAALIHAVFLLEEQVPDMDMAAAAATVTATPARAAGLHDRGRIEPGLVADLLRVHDHDHHPILRGVWRDGQRIA